MSFETSYSCDTTNSWSSPEDNQLPVTAQHETCHDETIHNDMDSPVSKTLLNAFLEVCETEVKMNHFLKQQQSESHNRDDDDNMSTELRTLTSSEAKLRLDLENLDTSAFLPELCDSSDSVCSSQDDCESEYQGHPCILIDDRYNSTNSVSEKGISNRNLPLHEYIQRHNGTSDLSVFKCNETLSTKTSTTMSSQNTNISEFSQTDDCSNYDDVSVVEDYTNETRTKNQDKDLLQVMSSYLFGMHDYEVEPLWVSKNSSTDDKNTRSYQGTFCVFISTCMAICARNNENKLLPQQLFGSIVASLLITYIQLKIPHKVNEVHLAASILCVHLFLQSNIN